MNRIDRKFSDLKAKGKKAFIAFVTAGDPSLAATERIVRTLASSGADIIELGVPFSDPLADGPVIQAASERSLKKKTNIHGIFDTVKKIRRNSEIPILLMTYYNPVFHYGVKKFFEDCSLFGVDGLIVPDLPVEESKEIYAYAKESGIANVFLAAPTSTSDRLKRIADTSRGFIYYVALTGVTGSSKGSLDDIGHKVRTIKGMTDKPVAVGFGVSHPEEARQIAKVADGVIIGSAIVKLIAQAGISEDAMLKLVGNFAKKAAEAIHG